MRQITLKILSVALAILRMVQDGIDIVEDIPFRYPLTIPGLESLERPIGDVFAAISAIFGVGVVGEAL
jgi:hypothetical protein